jgi:hypothetical protein
MPPVEQPSTEPVVHPQGNVTVLTPLATSSKPNETLYEYHTLPAAAASDTPSREVTPSASKSSFAVITPLDDLMFRESTWYARADYFHWNEKFDGHDFVNEYGTLATLGYEHRVERQRVRGELFGSTVNYVGSSQSSDPNVGDVPLHSATKYLGLRGEYEYLIEPEGTPAVSFFVGIGTRFWIRDMVDDYDDNGNFVQGYQETWWTIYPYLGIEKRRTHDAEIEFYYSARAGCTPITYERIEDFSTNLYPKTGLTCQLEAGIRGRRFQLAFYLEYMGWTQSDVVRDSLQPASTLTALGIKAGYCF